MSWHREIWTYLIVTVVTVLIWFWAAGETREARTLNSARLQFIVPEPENWIITPNQSGATLVVEGSKLAIQRIEQLLRRPLELDVVRSTGRQTIDVVDRVRQNEDIRSTGVTVRSAEPNLIELDLDQIERMQVPVKAVLPGIMPEGDVTIEPAEVTLAIPSRLKHRLPAALVVEASVERADLERLHPGMRQTLDAKLRMPEGSGTNGEVTLAPLKAAVTFTIRSRIREAQVQTVNVQLAETSQDRDGYVVELEPTQLRNVIVSADADLIQHIQNGTATVVAIVHLSSREKEARIDSKTITCFMALVTEADGTTRGAQVSARIGQSSEMPVIKLRITARAGG